MKLAVVFLVLLTTYSSAYSQTSVEPLAQKWVSRYNGHAGKNDLSAVVKVDSAGDVYTLGHSLNGANEWVATLIKQNDATGDRIWEWRANNPFANIYSTDEFIRHPAWLGVGTDRNLLIYVTERLVKVRSSDGVEIWSVNVPVEPYSFSYRAMALDAIGDVFLCGSNSKGGLVTKFSGMTGVKVWERSFSAPGGGRNSGAVVAESIVVGPSGDVLIAGATFIKGSLKKQLYTAKHSGVDGAILWESYIDIQTEDFFARLIRLAPNGNFVVATTSGHILMYSGENGAVLWQKLSAQHPYDLLFDASGNIIAAINTPTTAQARGASLVKFASVDGSIQWNHSTSVEFFASLLLRGAEILVAGQGRFESGDLMLAAFDPATGKRRWDVIYGESNLRDRMTNTRYSDGRIALQPDGGVVITGCSQGQVTGYDFATLRFAPGPAVKSGIATWALESSALLSTQAAGNGQPATVHWEYGTTPAYGKTTKALQIGSGIRLTRFEMLISDLPENTTYHARAVATNSTGIVTYGEDFVFRTGWDSNDNQLPDSWELAKWGSTTLHSAFADDDRDGLTNLVEYAFDCNPRAPDASSALPIAPAGDFLTAVITKRPFVEYVVEASSNLVDWSTAELSVVVDDDSTLVVRSNIPISGGGSQYMRVRITVRRQ